VTATFAAQPGSLMQYNRLQHQNVGELQHDGEGIGAGKAGTPKTKFQYNWVDYSHHSLTLRFDCAQDDNFKTVARGGTMKYNVGFGLVSTF